MKLRTELRPVTTLVVICLFAVSAVAFAGGVPRDLPRMRSALDNLEKAQAELRLAEDNKGGYKAKAMTDVTSASKEVRMGIKAAGGAHASFNREAPDQPHMEKALEFLNLAKADLEAATDNAGGHRSLAIDWVNKAIANVNLGIAWVGSK